MLGFDSPLVEELRNWLSRSGGMLLISGPTGSGKTTTFYAMCREEHQNGQRVVTIEDPVERNIEGLSQVNCGNERYTRTASLIRSVVRLDPDVIGVGEIRDADSAHAAVRACLSGHQVLATIHGTSPLSVVSLLRHWGLASYEIAGSLTMSLSQRLVRKLCRVCRSCVPLPKETAAVFNHSNVVAPESVYLPTGCDSCHHTGFFGRTTIYDVWVPTLAECDAIRVGAEECRLRSETDRLDQAFTESGLKLVAEGVTTIHEVQRWVRPSLVETTEGVVRSSSPA
jgi:general secretion pathway protein E